MIINPYAFGVAYDPDAQAFFTASGLTGATNLTAINNLVVALKGYGIWTKMKAIYPFVGGTAALHKWNLKDPQDTNAAFRLVFNGGWTHSSTGALPGGVNGYANTFLNPQSNFTINNVHLSHYSRTQITNTSSHDIGCETSPANNWLDLYQYFNSVSAKGFLSGTVLADRAEANNTNTLGFLIGSRTSSTSIKSYFNNSLIGTNTNINPATQYPNFNLFISATNSANIAAQAYSSKQVAFASIGDGLTDTEAANFYTAVQAYQTTLGRNV